MSRNNGHPIILADILLSSSCSEGQINLPLFLNGTSKVLEKMEGPKPIGKLIQKLYIINSHLCVALGGRFDQMYSFLRAIKAYFEHYTPTEQELVDFLTQFDEQKKDQIIGLVLFVVDVNGRAEFMSHFIGEWKGRRHHLFEEDYASGSGKVDFLNQVESSVN